MAIEVRVPKEITEYQERVVGNLSIRKLIIVFISSAVSIGMGACLTRIVGMSMSNASWLIIFVNLPILCFGWYRKHNLTFEKYMKVVLNYHLSSGVRVYRTNKRRDDYVKKD